MFHPIIDRFSRFFDCCESLRLNLPQHPSFRRHWWRRPADADPKSREVVCSQMFDDRANAVVPGSTSTKFERELAGSGVHVVMHDQDVLGIDLVEVDEGGDGFA